jgi:hypothetical protein
MATVALIGPDYQHDNKLVWNILARLVGAGNAWPFIKHLAPTFDARAAIKILKTQSQGSASDSSRRARAFGIIKKTIYTGKSAKFPFDTFVEKLQYAFTELAETNTAQTEAQKVQTLIKNIHSDVLKGTFPVVLNDPKLEANFGATCAFLSNYLTKCHAIDPTRKDRSVASTTTVQSSRSYTDEEWKALSAAEKRAVIRKRRKDKTKKKRKAAAVQSAADTSTSISFADRYKKLKAKKLKVNKEIAAIQRKHDITDSEGSSGEETVTVGNRRTSSRQET